MLAAKRISTHTQPLQRNIYIIDVTIKGMRMHAFNAWSVQAGRKQWGKAFGVVSEGKERAKETEKEHHRGRKIMRTPYVMQINGKRGPRKNIECGAEASGKGEKTIICWLTDYPYV